MKPYLVIFTPEAEEHLAELYHYIATKSSANVAMRYTNGIVDYCDAMKSFPHRGTRRDDIRPGLRITHYKKNAVIAFAVDDANFEVAILGVFYGGRDYASGLDVDVNI